MHVHIKETYKNFVQGSKGSAASFRIAVNRPHVQYVRQIVPEKKEIMDLFLIPHHSELKHYAAFYFEYPLWCGGGGVKSVGSGGGGIDRKDPK